MPSAVYMINLRFAFGVWNKNFCNYSVNTRVEVFAATMQVNLDISVFHVPECKYRLIFTVTNLPASADFIICFSVSVPGFPQNLLPLSAVAYGFERSVNYGSSYGNGTNG
jgi:hypothetical protein